MSEISVVLVEDQWHWRDSVARQLERTFDIAVVAEAETAEHAINQIRAHQPRVALVDLRLQGDDHAGFAVARAARESSPGTALVIFTELLTPESVIEAQLLGVSGFLRKQEINDPSRLREVVRLAADGVVLLTASVAQQITSRIKAADPSAVFDFTAREREAANLLARGRTNADIAAALSIEYQSAKNLVRRVVGKVGASNRLEAVLMLQEHGFPLHGDLK